MRKLKEWLLFVPAVVSCILTVAMLWKPEKGLLFGAIIAVIYILTMLFIYREAQKDLQKNL